MEGDCRPDGVGLGLGNAVSPQELARSIRAVDSKRSFRLLCRGVSPMSWNMAPA
jgi:hypothetical protein